MFCLYVLTSEQAFLGSDYTKIVVAGFGGIPFDYLYLQNQKKA